MLVSKQWLQDFIVEPLPETERLAEELNVKIWEVEDIQVFEDDEILDIKVLPDRAHYALSHRGIAREICAIFALTFKDFVPEIDLHKYDSENLKIEIENTDLCRRYFAVRIDGITVGESPNWLKQRLESIGQRPINNIVDITNYVMYALGQPLHAFDADLVVGGLTARAGREGEVLKLLDSADSRTQNREIILGQGECVIADDQEPLVLAGIKGGAKSSISAKTKNIILEGANFSPVVTRRFATLYNSRSDTSKRFENEISPAYAEDGLRLASKLVQEIAGGQIVASKDVYPIKKEILPVAVSLSEINNRLGVELSANEVTKILSQAGLLFVEQDNLWTVTPAADRVFDLQIAADLIEEIGRLYGMDKIKAKTPLVLAEVKPPKQFIVEQIIRNFLILRGWSEVISYALTKHGAVALANSVSVDKKFMRQNLSEAIQESLGFNAKSADLLGLEQIKIFEIGQVFLANTEESRLCLGLKNIKKIKGKTADDILKDLWQDLLSELNIKMEAKISDGILEIKLSDLLSEVDDKIILPDLRLGLKETKFLAFSSFPFVVRDVACWVPDSEPKPEAVIENIIQSHSAGLLVRLVLFDRFDKDGRVSLAYRLVLQAMDRTLEEEEISTIMNKIYNELKLKAGWEIR